MLMGSKGKANGDKKTVVGPKLKYRYPNANIFGF